MFHLIKKAQKGNDQAFLQLFQQYEQDIYRIAYVYVKNQHDALDIVQETAYRSFKSIKQLNEPAYFKTWLVRIAISCALDILRKQKNVVQFNPDFEGIFPGEDLEDIDLELTLRDLIEHLNEDEKSIVILKYYEDLTFKEAADALGIPLGTAKTILYRALARLRKDLKGVGVYEQ